MYESFFGFAKRPFLAAPTLDRYFPASSMEMTTQTATRAIQRAEGPVAIFGGTGLGKTMCCLRIADFFRRNFEVVSLASSQLITRRALLQSLLYELRMPYRDMSEGELRLTLMNRLQLSVDNPTDGLVLIVDEAHTLSMKLLEELRLMTNLVRNGVPRVRLVLCGTMRLEELLAHPHMESLNQRLAARCYLTPLNQQETRQYVSHKIELCGVNCSDAMTRDALDSIFRGSDGIPRLIDQLADQSLLLACNEQERPVSASLVGKAWSMLQQLPNPWSAPETISRATASQDFSMRSADERSIAPSIAIPSMATPTIAAAFVPTANTNQAFSAIEFGSLEDMDTPKPLSPRTQDDFEFQLAPIAAVPPVPAKNLLDVFAGDFEEEFTIPVQSSGSYHAYSGVAYGKLNHDVLNFDGQQSNPPQFEIEESDTFLDAPNVTSSPSHTPQSNSVEPDYPISNISPEQVASIEAQIEDEMRDLVSNLNMSAMSFDPERSIDRSKTTGFATSSREDGVQDRKLSHPPHAGVVSFSGLYDISDRSSDHALSGDDRDLLMIEDDIAAAHDTGNTSTATSSRNVVHPYAKLFSKLRNV